VCSSGTYSEEGAAACGLWRVRFAVALPMTAVDFDAERQALLTKAVSRAAGVLPARISIDEIEVIASSSSIRVDITIIVGSDSSARNVAKSLTLSALNYELNLEGLPGGVMVYVKKCGLGFRAHGAQGPWRSGPKVLCYVGV
jgi:hypothetical protein